MCGDAVCRLRFERLTHREWLDDFPALSLENSFAAEPPPPRGLLRTSSIFFE